MKKKKIGNILLQKSTDIIKGKTLENNGDFYCLYCFHSLRAENKLSHEKVCKNKDFYWIVLASQKANTLEFNQYMKSDKMPCIIYIDFESLNNVIDNCKTNSEISLAAKIGKQVPCG